MFPYYLYLERPPLLRGGKDGMSDSQPRPLKSLVEQQNGRYDCFYTLKLLNSVNFVFCLCRSNPQDTLMEKPEREIIIFRYKIDKSLKVTVEIPLFQRNIPLNYVKCSIKNCL